MLEFYAKGCIIQELLCINSMICCMQKSSVSVQQTPVMRMSDKQSWPSNVKCMLDFVVLFYYHFHRILAVNLCEQCSSVLYGRDRYCKLLVSQSVCRARTLA